MEQVRLCAVWPMDNWLGSSLKHIQGWTTVGESYSLALEHGPLDPSPIEEIGHTIPLPVVPLSQSCIHTCRIIQRVGYVILAQAHVSVTHSTLKLLSPVCTIQYVL